jgi:hypothetical protein
MFRKPLMLVALVVMGSARLRGTLQHVVNALAGLLAVGQLADVAIDEAKARPLLGRHQALHFVQVALVASGKVV